ncbi:MarR family winged helix-turn-helix transcriptional regulator [Rhodococcus marinonascens]|uniref:MarR family winged helix-turn-helix transcriptional regulator n=1 Tax=Rhodococcus marinonascens TaxID=38311 RepID=UPI000932DD61|nr:MarR family transcriptional regulator [Rhodococcus marinonascens]
MDEKVNQLREDVVLFLRRIRAQRAGHQLTPSQLQALSHLDREGPMSARALAGLEQVAPQSIARTLSILEDAAMVSRTADPHDARASIIAITALGSQTLVGDRSRRSEWLSAAIASECTDAERDLLFIAGRLLRRLAEIPDPAPQRESLMTP